MNSEFHNLVFIKVHPETDKEEISYINVFTITEIRSDGGIYTSNSFKTNGRPFIYYIKGCHNAEDVMDFFERNKIFDLNNEL